MIFNGHTEQYINSLDEELFAELQVMYADGMLGNKGIYNALTPLTTAIFNYIRGANTPPFKSDQMFPWINEYSIDPEVKDESASNSLLTFMSQAPDFKINRFNKNAN